MLLKSNLWWFILTFLYVTNKCRHGSKRSFYKKQSSARETEWHIANCKWNVEAYMVFTGRSSSSVLLYTRNMNCRNGLTRSVSSLHCHYFYFISAGQREMYKLILTAQFMSIPEVSRGHLGNFNSQVPMRFNISTEDGESKRWRGFYFPFQEVYFSIEVDLWFCREISWDSESKLIFPGN